MKEKGSALGRKSEREFIKFISSHKILYYNSYNIDDYTAIANLFYGLSGL